MDIGAFFDPATSTLTYVVHDPKTNDAVVIDPVLDFDPTGGTTSLKALDPVLDFLKENRLTLRMIMETHAHADHLSGSQVLKERFPDAVLAIGEPITKVQAMFREVLDFPADFKADGSQFDRLLKEGEIVRAGSIEFQVLLTPGHTPACASYLLGDAVFTGDALFMPDYGTGRCDFPGGNAQDLYESVTKKLYALTDETRVLSGHDYLPGGRPLRYESTIGEEKRRNIQLTAETLELDYIGFRTTRDKTLAPPKLLYPSLQVNLDGGRLPHPAANGISYLKIPLNWPSAPRQRR